ncbi:hypothetical protein HDK64DRAFT_28187 [Phyllosticta capitalensis]|uniref:DUF6594 domain-containing protein n=1 Tax=Phyllosticta capitalensis TaxID=121624 RepID=A0ABR1YWC6_9PEZI
MPLVDDTSSPTRDRDGYPSLAAHIADSTLPPPYQPSSVNDASGRSNAFIFRKFNKLSARNLLMLEKRGMELEEELDKLDKMTREGWVWDGRVSGSNKGEGAGVDVRKREILGELELWIGKYQKALYHQSLVAALPAPAPSDLSSLRRWFSGETVTNGLVNGTDGSHILARPLLSGSARYKYDDEADLVALRPSGNSNRHAEVSEKPVVPIPRFLKENWANRRKSLPFALAGLPPSTPTPANSPVNAADSAGVHSNTPWSSLAPLSLRTTAPYFSPPTSIPDPGSNTDGMPTNGSIASWPTALASTLIFLVIGSATGFYMSHAQNLSTSQARGVEGILLLTALFAISVGSLTNARRGEVVAATGLHAVVLGGCVVWGALRSLGEREGKREV